MADFPPIHRHGVIGDRRTGALVAADGSINWLCAPNFDGPPVFGSLLDPIKGGVCRLAAEHQGFGSQRYRPDTATLITAWAAEDGTPQLEVVDVMIRPNDERPKEQKDERIILRHVRAHCDSAIEFIVRPRWSFKAPIAVHRGAGTVFEFSGGSVGCWTSFPLSADLESASARVSLRAGEEGWAVVGWSLSPDDWSVDRAAEEMSGAERYWRDWSAELCFEGAEERLPALKRSAITVNLLRQVQHGSAVAALTTSLPERLGGGRNYDYRYAWIRDASLSMALLARRGKVAEVECYLSWLSGLRSSTDSPLQVCYRPDGGTNLDEEELPDLRGYGDSRPVRCGNRAAQQRQLASLGYFADCARIYFDHGGHWHEDYWNLIRRAAEYTQSRWHEKDCGIWELPTEAHYVSSKVLSWVVLERALYLAGKTGQTKACARWRETAAAIHAEVMEFGWCEKKQAFRQRYGSDALDASALLIPLMGFLPIAHPRVSGTVSALERELTVEGLLHRFDPKAMPDGDHLPIGEEEGAFLPCVFWHAHVLAKVGRCDEAEAILLRCETIAGELGLFAEEADARRGTFLGNTPLLFSHVEYVRAAVELAAARTRSSTHSTPSHYESAH